MNIQKMLVLSTAHLPGPITPDSAPEPIWYEKGEYGWIVFTHLFQTPLNTSPELIHIMTCAAKMGCDWVMFDRDASIHPDFPTFDW